MIIFGLILLIILLWLAHKYYHQSRQTKLLHQPLPANWIAIVKKNVSLYSLLPEALQNELHGYIQLFLDEKEFIGKSIDITDEIRLTIAGNACLLLLQGHKKTFPGFTSILVYPDTYVARQVSYDGSVEVHETSHRAGESWMRGPVVLSWSDVMRGSLNSKDAHNVVLHEFAHKLDEQNGIMDGLPILREKTDYAAWTAILRQEYDALQTRANRGENKVLDEYGTVSAPEFFAVATESFFEKPLQMKTKLPNLYEQLNKFYNVDPAAWHR